MKPSVSRKRILLPIFVSLFGVGLFIAHAGCGILLFPVLVPAAIAANHNYSIKGTLVDDAGAPLNEVLVHISNQHTYWEPWSGQTSVDESKTVACNGNFDFPWVRGNTVSFSFSKVGFTSRQIAMNEDNFRQDSAFGFYWPNDKPARVMLVPLNRQYPALRQGTGAVLHAQDDSISVVDLLHPDVVTEHFREVPRASYTPVPTDMSIDIEMQPLKTHGPDNAVDPSDIGLPAHLTLRIAGGGFVSFVPTVGADPFEQMPEAPADGYTPELTFAAPRLKEMRKAGGNYVIQGHEFFYFRFADKFGKGALSWDEKNCDPQTEFHLTLAINPDGSRNLATAEAAKR